MSDQRAEVESTGETVGEARWAALHELERRYPSLDRDAVEFVVVSEGERGLLGVGYQPARVLASVTVDPDAPATPAEREPAPAHADDSPGAARVREMVGRILIAMELEGDIDLAEGDGVVTVTVHGPDLGLLIGKHGQTIDAIQYLANAIQHRREERPLEVVVDAEGYRKRRERCAQHRRAGRARADDVGGTQDRPHQGAVDGRADHVQRGRRAESLRGR